MDGIHDMGGMDGFGRVKREADEPVFHHEWERRTVGKLMSMFTQRFFHIDEYRQKMEQMDPVAYLAPYYTRWIHTACELLVDKGLITRDELASGKVVGKASGIEPLSAEAIPGLLRARISGRQEESLPARYKAGDAVRARNIHPPHHTRTPRYVRGKSGTVMRTYGVFNLPDSHAQNTGGNPQHVYSVRFTARELWGDEAPANDSLCIDMWDEYLEMP